MSDYQLCTLSLVYQDIPYTNMLAQDHPDRERMPSGAFYCISTGEAVQWVFMENGSLIGTWDEEKQYWDMHFGGECLLDMVDWRLNMFPKAWLEQQRLYKPILFRRVEEGATL